jgi:hypothetical protein
VVKEYASVIGDQARGTIKPSLMPEIDHKQRDVVLLPQFGSLVRVTGFCLEWSEKKDWLGIRATALNWATSYRSESGLSY